MEFGESKRFSSRGAAPTQTGFDGSGSTGFNAVPGCDSQQFNGSSMFDAPPPQKGRVGHRSGGSGSLGKLTIALFIFSLLMIGVSAVMLL